VGGLDSVQWETQKNVASQCYFKFASLCCMHMLIDIQVLFWLNFDYLGLTMAIVTDFQFMDSY